MPTERSNEDQDPGLRIARIDDAVAGVFEIMLRQRCVPVDRPSSVIASLSDRNIEAKIAFSGTLAGQCAVRASIATASLLTSALLGAEGNWDNAMIDDAMGELCNMIAGGWKSALDASGAMCHISVPTVSRSYPTQTPHDTAITTRRFYSFNGSPLEVALTIT